MGLDPKLTQLLRTPRLTTGRIVLALAIAIISDALQVLLQGIPLAPEIVDVIAMGLMIFTVGFHVLLLPTFLVEFIPIVDMLPTWTGCVAAVIALRLREQRTIPPPPIVTASPPPAPSPQLESSNPNQGTVPR